MSSVRPVIDAGPALNFLAINQARLLLSVLGQISTPETVESEVLRKSGTDPRFEGVQLVWSKLTPRWIEVLCDDVTVELDAVCQRIGQTGLAERKKQAKDLGELLVVAHAVVAAEQGLDVTVVIDDQSGAAIAASEAQRLDRHRAQGRLVGRITLVNTLGILTGAAGGRYLPDRATMKKIYARLRECDDGLPPITQTKLLSAHVWNRDAAVVTGART
ncbi:hypothetical protein [Nocardia amikacinitolerans]|uniref:hypothetical protein n=1 Tax=Nocardia amikacinitolerans TaxID=756689 RepID=UPI0020A30864|nr:hypothetical protein [Nocardia amikacinitolerans]MCP2290510.1 hypothetical protein [Nocardia amikacinitolerans]